MARWLDFSKMQGAPTHYDNSKTFEIPLSLKEQVEKMKRENGLCKDKATHNNAMLLSDSRTVVEAIAGDLRRLLPQDN